MRFSGNGCQPCKDSRKKCDGQKPACCRCIRAGKTCYGYREAFSIIHAEDIYASRKHKRPRGPRRKADPETSIIASLPRDVYSEALAYYTHYYLKPAESQSALSAKIHEAVMSTWTSTPALSSAMSCLSLVIFSKVKSHPLAARQASINYQTSLHALQTALPNIGTTNVDACLLTIYFLARYEDSVHGSSANTKPLYLRSRAHLDGIRAGLEYWRNNVSAPQGTTCVITYCRRALRKAALLGQFNMPIWLHNGALFGESGSDLDLDRIIMRLIVLRGKICSQLENDTLAPVSLLTFEALSAEALEIDEAFREWIHRYLDVAHDPPHNLGKRIVWSDDGICQPKSYAHQNHLTTAVRAQCCGYRILTNHLRASILDVISTHTSDNSIFQLYVECRCKLNLLAHDLAMTILFWFGEVKTSNDLYLLGTNLTTSENHILLPHVAELLAAPLVIASTTKYVDGIYTKWFKYHLGNVGRLTGYGIMEDVANGSSFKL